MKYRSIVCALIALLVSAAGALHAQVNPNVKWKVLTPKLTGKPGEIVELKLQPVIAAGSWLYTTKRYPDSVLASPQPTEITVGESSLLTRAGRIRGTKPKVKYDEGFEIETEYWKGSPTIIVPVKISGTAATGTVEKGWVNIYFQTCDDSSCQPPTEKKMTFEVVIGDAAETAADTSTATGDDLVEETGMDTATAPTTDTAVTMVGGTTADTATASPVSGKMDDGDRGEGGKVLTGSAEDIARAKEQGLGAFLWLAVLMGLGALVTPCVFPMIPITVSFFTKRPQTTRTRTIRDALLYSLGIILTFTALGLVATLIMGATGVNDIATNPVANIIIAGIFLALALNLFGMFEIQVPASIMNRLNKKAQGDSVMSVILMGLVFSLTSFTCTVPFVGTLFASAAGGEYVWPLIGTAMFAAVFSAPFFVLALFPALMKSLPKSGGWLNAVKVVMGFIEVAAAIKFLSTADMVLQWGVLTRELFLAIWIAVAVLVTLYLLGHFRLPHDTPVEKVGPIRVLFAISFLAVGFWLLTGLFGGRLGELDAQIPPTDYSNNHGATLALAPGNGGGSGQGGQAAQAEGEWVKDDFERALEISRSTGKPIFIDFTGYACTNCRWMEANMFSREEVASLMDNYVRVKLYTDGRDTLSRKNQKMQFARYNTITLPYYVLLTPGDSTIAKFEGMTRNPDHFLGFLRKGITGGELAVNE